uniref:NADH:ubiquinone reductase (H(+)-translocating) n=1 Tax=Botrylloides giganteus TaxID=2034436 RepID=A0A024GW80_9ASCI|nr:NADH dehydrogenase subunit 5 [Botrylloides giganteus]CCO25721.1 NADH dehydrogenase subunit 5 [Botrylloides giganteus]
MVSSLLFFLVSLGFMFLFFFLVGLQLLFWKVRSLGTFRNVFGTYKFALIGGALSLEVFFLSLGEYGVNVFLELNLWFNMTPYVSVDFFSCVFFVCALMVSWSIMDFGVSYMTDEGGVGNFLFYLLIFLLLMFVLVFSGNFLMLFVGWEGVGLLSFLLISWWGGRFGASAGSLQAVYYNRVGDSGLLLFLVISLILGNGVWIMNSFMVSSFFLFFVLGVVSKSSQLLFHPWLPNAMEGPTPVSSLLHSSTMVMAGVFLLMRSLEFFEYRGMIYLVGVCTCVLGGVLGMSHGDFKKVVAYSTTSQLGFMMVVLGLGWDWLCLLYMMIHAFFKAMIFMMSGVVIHMSGGIQDFRHMSGNLMLNGLMFFFYSVGGVVMMGFPFLSGFWMKDVILEGAMGSYLGFFSWCFFNVSVLLTGLYSMRLYFGGFMGNLVSPPKLMALGALRPYLSFLRLLLGSVCLGGFVYFLGGPFGHVLLAMGDKFFAIVVFVLGVGVSFLLVSALKGTSFLLGGYLLFFNPIYHKVLVFVGGWVSYVVGLLDFLMVEFLFYGGVKFIWSSGLSFRFGLVFMLLLVFSLF